MWRSAPRLAVADGTVVAALAAQTQPAAGAGVPPGGLVTSFVGNQATYCSLICPLAVQTVATAAVTAVQSPAVFVAGLQSGDVLKALGAAAASVTGPTNDAAAATIVADGTVVAPRAFNAFEVEGGEAGHTEPHD